MEWEYKTVIIEPDEGIFTTKFDGQKIYDILNEHGKEGWELVNVVSTNRIYGSSDLSICVFKRQT